MNEPILIALIGIAGAVIGSIATVIGSVVKHCLQERSAKNKEKPARDLLIEMLNHESYAWRELNTLMHVIGCDAEKTKQLLLEIGARASEDGKQLSALKSRVPLIKK